MKKRNALPLGRLNFYNDGFHYVSMYLYECMLILSNIAHIFPVSSRYYMATKK